MTMRITITKPYVMSTYGIAYPVWSTQTVSAEYGRDLVSQGRATDTDGVLLAPQNKPFASDQPVVESNEIVLDDGQKFKPLPRPRIAFLGQSTYMRGFYDAAILNASAAGGVLTINTTAAHALMTGAMCYCTMPGIQAQGRITVTGTAQVTLPWDGPPVATVTGTGAPDSLIWLGGYTGASWEGRLHARYGLNWLVLAAAVRHGDNIENATPRIAQVVAANADIIVPEFGGGNSINQGVAYSVWFPAAFANFQTLQATGAKLVMGTLPPPDSSIGALTEQAICDFNRWNAWVMNSSREYPNVISVNATSTMLDKTSTSSYAIADTHIDSLHFTPRGAALQFVDFYGGLDQLLAPASALRWGAADVWVNGNRQLFDGLLVDGTGQAQAGTGVSGAWDVTATIASAGGGGSRTAVGSLVERSAPYAGLYMQRVVFALMGTTTVWQLNFVGATGELIAARLVPGRTYRLCARVAITDIDVGVRFSVLGMVTLTGIPGHTTECMAWCGRSQRGTIELGSTGAAQIDDETHDYIGEEFTIPASAAIAAASLRIVVESAGNNSGCTVDVHDICWRDVTP